MKMCDILQANVLIDHLRVIIRTISSTRRDLTLQKLISHTRTEEANRLKDNMSSISLNSINSTKSAMPMNKSTFKGKGKKFEKQNLTE